MCFSAEASFATGTVLLITGIASIKNVSEKNQLMFASIPIVFAVQQFFEGFLWISLNNPAYENWNSPLTHTFLLFAQVLWPSWVPIAFLLAEKNTTRKKLLMAVSCIGILLSLYLLYCLLNYSVNSVVSSHHIFYRVDYPDLDGYGTLFYFFAAISPPFISGMKWAWILGLLNLASLIISKILFNDHVISVWCFIAAAISVIIYFMIRETNKRRVE